MVLVRLPPPLRDPRPIHAPLPSGLDLVRIFDPAWLGPTEFNAHGPRGRFDHHRSTPDPERRIYYAAADLKGCLVEVFGDTGVIATGGFRIALLQLRRPVSLLDLRGDGALAIGSVAALAKIPDRAVSQSWARWIYEHPADFDRVDGIAYHNAHIDDAAFALFERAEDAIRLVADLPLAADLLRAPIRAVAERCNMIVEPY